MSSHVLVASSTAHAFENMRSSDQIFAIIFFSTHVSNVSGITEGLTKVVCDVGGDGLCPHMAVVTLEYSVHTLGL